MDTHVSTPINSTPTNARVWVRPAWSTEKAWVITDGLHIHSVHLTWEEAADRCRKRGNSDCLKCQDLIIGKCLTN